jgi:hypothetical protein
MDRANSTVTRERGLVRRIAGSILGVAVLGLAGCDWITGPEPLNGPYYYYHGGERIPVAVDRTHIVVRAASWTTLSEERFPVGVEIVRRFGITSGYEVFELAPPATAAAEQALGGLARTLQALPEVRFASFRYTVPSSDAWFFPLEDVLVSFRTGVSAAEIQAFSARFNVRLVASPDQDALRFYYVFHRLDPDPDDLLHLVAAMYRSPLTEWVETDRWSNVRNM